MFSKFKSKKEVETTEEETKEQQKEKLEMTQRPANCYLVEEKAEMVFRVDGEIEYFIKVFKKGSYFPKVFLDKELNDETEIKAELLGLDKPDLIRTISGDRFVDRMQLGFFDLNDCLDCVIYKVNKFISECIRKVTKDQIKKELMKKDSDINE